MTAAVVYALFLAPVASAGLAAAAEGATASSTNALSAGSGYWCSAGAHSPGETVTFTAELSSARALEGVRVSWAHAPAEVRVLTSPDGSSFEEAACWQQTGKGDDAYTETFQFSRAHQAKAVAIAMRGPRASGYFGISQVVMESAAAAPTMLVAGVTAGEELCVVVENGSVDQRGALVTAEPCAEAIAAGDGREVFVMTEAGQLATGGAGSGLCAILAGNSASGGGEIELDDCEAAAETGDGRSFWALAPSGQLTLAGGSYCMVLAGGAGGNGADVAPTATVAVTATADSAHGAEKLTDGDAASYWQSPPADTLAGGPLSISFELAETARVSSVAIDWQEPAMDFTVQTAEEGGQWATFAEVQGNTLGQTVVRGSSVVAKKVRVLLTAPVGGAAPLLAGAVRQLGQYTAELSALKPKIEACKKASFLGSGASFLALEAKVGEAPRYQQQ